MSVHVSEAPVYTIIADRELFMVYTQKMQHSGMDIINLGWVFAVQRLVAPLVTFSSSNSSLDSSSAKPVGENVRIVVTPLTALSAGHTSKFCGPVYDGVI